MAETVSMPKLGFDMREGVLVRWVKNEGETINKGDILAEIETDKATVEVESTAGGVVRNYWQVRGTPCRSARRSPSSAVRTRRSICPPETPKVQAARRKACTTIRPTPVPAPWAHAAAGASAIPVAQTGAKRRRWRRRSPVRTNWSLGVQGSGPGGRAVRRDVEAALADGVSSQAGTGGMAPPAFSPVSYEDETVQLTRLRQAIARRMTESKTSVPHFYVTHEYKMTRSPAEAGQLVPG
jgi:pyruvate dehydrogenase E2 component (dihydrolipoamide acetyltransferase)